MKLILRRSAVSDDPEVMETIKRIDEIKEEVVKLTERLERTKEASGAKVFQSRELNARIKKGDYRLSEKEKIEAESKRIEEQVNENRNRISAQQSKINALNSELKDLSAKFHSEYVLLDIAGMKSLE